MKIKYIIDYKGYGNTYQLTNTRTGECLDITREQAQDYKLSTTFMSIRAEVSLNSLPQTEVKDDSFTRRLEGVLLSQK
jgi:hypothetical protein